MNQPFNPLTDAQKSQLLDLAFNAALVCDAQGRIVYWNRGAEQLYGWGREEALGKSALELLESRLPQPLEQIYDQLRRQGEWQGEVKQTHRNGAGILVLSRWALAATSAADASSILQIDRDITSGRRAEEVSRMEFLVLRTLGEAVDLTDAATRVLETLSRELFWSQGEYWSVSETDLKCIAVYGDAPCAQVAAANESALLDEFFRPLDGEAAGALSEVCRTGQPLLMSLDAVPAEWRPEQAARAAGMTDVLVFPIQNQHHLRGVFRLFRNMQAVPPAQGVAVSDEALLQALSLAAAPMGQFVERWSAQVALRRSEARFRSLLESAPDGILIANSRGAIQLANQQAEMMFGYTRQELTSMRVEDLMPERFRRNHEHHRGSYTRHPQVRPMGVGLELFARRKDGVEFPVEISLSPIHIDDEPLVIAVLRDVTTRKQAESAAHELQQVKLAEAEHLATLGEIAAGLAHEIKNPLAGIAAVLEVLGSSYAEGHPDRELMLEVKQQVKRIKVTVDDLLNYARPKPIELLESDLNATVEQVVHFTMQQAAAHHVNIVWHNYQLPPVRHDPEQIQRLVMNLVLNAVQAVEQGSTITVSTGWSPRRGGEASIAVEDHGPGIPASELEKIFRPFYTTKGRSGTGLGLSVCQRIAKLHNGRIEVTSRPGEGSTFVVWLPCPARPPAIHPASGGGRRPTTEGAAPAASEEKS